MELVLTVGTATGLLTHKSLEGSKTVVLGRLYNSDGWLRTQALKHDHDLTWNASFGLTVWTLSDALELHVVNESPTIKERKSLGKLLIPLADIQAVPGKTVRKSYTFMDGCPGSIELFLQLSGTLPPARIAIVGAGIAGAAAARFLCDRYADLGSKANITIFEEDTNIGGRIANVTIAGETVELGGGQVINTGKGYFFEFAKRFGLELQQATESNVDWGIWNGERIIYERPRDTSQYLMTLLERYGPSSMTALHEAQTSVFSKYNELFECVARLNSYYHLPDLLTDGRLYQLTQLTLTEYLRNRGVAPQAIEELVVPLCRRFFGLPPHAINALAGIGATLLDTAPLYSIKGGNITLVNALLKGTGALLHAGRRVSAITRNAATHSWVITAKQGKDKKDTTKHEFDAIIIATPAYSIKKIKFDFELPPALSQLRQYVEVYEAYVAGDLNDKYFHIKEGTSNVQSILTTNEKDIPFTSITKVRALPEGRGIYRLVSHQAISESMLKNVFRKITEKQMHHWQAAYPVPQLTTESILPPFAINQRVYFANPMEHCFPSLEGALLGARNVTGLLLKSLVRPLPPIRVLKGAQPSSSLLGGPIDPSANVADVVVVGSGLSGLTTALRVLQGTPAGQRPFKVVVLEASNTLGGRTRSLELPESPFHEKVSYGGTWVAFDDEQTLSLSRELKFMPFAPKGDQGTSFILSNIVLHPLFLIKLWFLGEDIRKDPKEHLSLDATPLSEWLADQHGALDKKAAMAAVRDYFTAIEDYPYDLSKVSTYFAARSLNLRLSNITRTGFIVPQIFRWEGGTGAFIRKILTAVLDLGGEIRTNSRVREVRQELQAGQATVVLEDGSFYTAKQVVLATSPPAAASLKYEPPLQAEAMKISTLLKGWDDPAIQLVMSWPTRFWKMRGTVVVPAQEEDATGVYGPIMDLSDHDPRTQFKSQTGIIRILVKLSRVADGKGRLWDKERLKADAARYLEKYLQTPHEAILRDMQDFIVFNWEDEKDIGHVAWYYPPTKDCTYAKLLPWLRRPHGLVRFAGSERSERGFHWMEGAIRRGNEVAGECLNALAPGKFNLKIYWQRFKHFTSEALNDIHRREVLGLGRNIVDLFSHLFHPLLTVTKATRDLFAFMQRVNTRLIAGPPGTPLITGPVAPMRTESLTENEQALYDTLFKKYAEPRTKAARLAFAKRDHVVDTSVIAVPWSATVVAPAPSSSNSAAVSPVSSPPQSRESTPQRPGRPIPGVAGQGRSGSPARGTPPHALAIRGSPPVPGLAGPKGAPGLAGSPPVGAVGSPPVERPELELRMGKVAEQLQLLHDIVNKEHVRLDKDETAIKLAKEARETREAMSRWMRHHPENTMLPRVLETLRLLEHEVRGYDEKVAWQQAGGRHHNLGVLSANPSSEAEQVLRAFAGQNGHLGYFGFPDQAALRLFLETHASYLSRGSAHFRIIVSCVDGNAARAVELIKWIRGAGSPHPRAHIAVIHPPKAPFKDLPSDKRVMLTDDLKAAQKFAAE